MGGNRGNRDMIFKMNFNVCRCRPFVDRFALRDRLLWALVHRGDCPSRTVVPNGGSDSDLRGFYVAIIMLNNMYEEKCFV